LDTPILIDQKNFHIFFFFSECLTLSAVLLFNQKCRGVFKKYPKSAIFASFLTLFALFYTFFNTFLSLFDRFLPSASFLIDAFHRFHLAHLNK